MTKEETNLPNDNKSVRPTDKIKKHILNTHIGVETAPTHEGCILNAMDEWAAIKADSQTIAGIKLALKKVKVLADQQYIERPMGNECSAYNSGISDMLGVLGFVDPAAILSELKNDIKEG